MSIVKVDKKNMMKAMEMVNVVIGKSLGTFANINSIIFRGENNTGYIDATNGAFDISCKIDIESDEPFRFGIKKEFFQALKNLDKEIRFISEDNKVVKIVSGKIKLKVTTDVLEFASIEVEKGCETLTVDKNDLEKAFELVSYAVSTDSSKPTLNGINFEYKEGRLRLCTCDGFRAAKYYIDAIGTNEISVIVIPEIIKLIEKFDKDNLEILIGKKAMIIKTENVKIGSMFYSGTFPNMESIFNDEEDKEIIIKNEEIKRATQLLKVARQMEGTTNVSKADALKFTISNNTLVCSDTSKSLEIEMQAETKSSDLEFLVNANYLLSAITNLGNDIKIKVKTSESPIKILNDDENYTSILLPIRY